MKEEYVLDHIDMDNREICVKKEEFEESEIAFATNEYKELMAIANNLHYNIVDIATEKINVKKGRSIIKKR